MKVYTYTEACGIYPVGFAAVIVARNRGHAKRLLLKIIEGHPELAASNPNAQAVLKLKDFKEVDVEQASVDVLVDGEY